MQELDRKQQGTGNLTRNSQLKQKIPETMKVLSIALKMNHVILIVSRTISYFGALEFNGKPISFQSLMGSRKTEMTV